MELLRKRFWIASFSYDQLKSTNKILIIRANAASSDPRVEKIIEVLDKHYQLQILGFDRSGKLPIHDKLQGVSVTRFQGIKWLARTRLKAINGLLFQLFILTKLFITRYDIIHACDFKTFAPALIPVKVRNKKIAYDIFDFFFDMVFKVPPGLKRVLIQIDLLSMRLADLVILADDSRKEQVGADRLTNCIVFYNSPADLFRTVKPHPIMQPDAQYALKLIYVGLVDNRKRDFRFAMDAIRTHSDVLLDIYGAGKDYDLMADTYKAAPNIRFLGKVPYSEICDIESQYDAIFAVYDPRIPNNVLASPNKLFEAMMLAKPIIINQELYVSSMVQKEAIGFTYPFNDKDAFNATLNKLKKHPALLKTNGNNGRKVYLERFSFQLQSQRLIDAYKHL